LLFEGSGNGQHVEHVLEEGREEVFGCSGLVRFETGQLESWKFGLFLGCDDLDAVFLVFHLVDDFV
jgi:hypothetical protein